MGFFEKAHSPCRKKTSFEKHEKNNERKVAKLLTYGGQVIDRTAYIYIYTHAVELKTGPRFEVSSVKNWSKPSVKSWSKFFFTVFPHFYSVFWLFLKTQIVSHCAKILLLQNFGDVKNEVFEKKIAFFVFLFYVGEIETEKRKKGKWKRPKKPIKIVSFKVVIQKCEKSKNGFLLPKLPDTICVRKGEKTRIFVHTICFGQKMFLAENSVNQEKL